MAYIDDNNCDLTVDYPKDNTKCALFYGTGTRFEIYRTDVTKEQGNASGKGIAQWNRSGEMEI